VHSKKGNGSTLSWNAKRFVKDHLQKVHVADLSQLTDAQLEDNELYICRECNEQQIFVSLTRLNNHIRAQHNDTRTLNNIQLVENYLFHDLRGDYDSHWTDGLHFLQQHQLQPPTFRQPLTTKIKWRLEQSITDTFTSIIELNNEALKPADNSDHHTRQCFDPWPLLQLQILFEQLVLFPITQNPNNLKAVNSTIHTRLRKFKQGRIRELYEESRLVVSKTPLEQAEAPVQIQRSAQIAADLDNYKTANSRLTKHAPVALINETNLHVLNNLHPPSLNRKCIKPQLRTRSGGTRRKFSCTPQSIIHTLSHLNRGKATGIQCDSLDIYIKSARRLNLNDTKDLRKAKAIAGFFNKVINGEIPEQFKIFLRQTYLVALEKDPEDKTKLRPLGVPSAIRRIASIIALR